jgi:uncharacterized membrane protein
MSMLAISTGYYNTLKFLHVLAAITWVGSTIYVQALATKVNREGDPTRLAATAKDIGDLGMRLILPASLAVLVFGVWLVAVSQWNFTDTWVLIGLAGIAVTVVTGAGFLGPESERLSKLSRERDLADPEIQGRIRRIFAISRVDLVVLILVVAVMVFKPGS